MFYLSNTDTHEVSSFQHGFSQVIPFQQMFKVLSSLNIEGRFVLPGTWGSMWQAPEIEDFFSEGPEWFSHYSSGFLVASAVDAEA